MPIGVSFYKENNIYYVIDMIDYSKYFHIFIICIFEWKSIIVNPEKLNLKIFYFWHIPKFRVIKLDKNGGNNNKSFKHLARNK